MNKWVKQCRVLPVQVVVLWVGTNNHQHTAEQVAEGVLAVAHLLTSRLPRAKVIIMVSTGGSSLG